MLIKRLKITVPGCSPRLNLLFNFSSCSCSSQQWTSRLIRRHGKLVITKLEDTIPVVPHQYPLVLTQVCQLATDSAGCCTNNASMTASIQECGQTSIDTSSTRVYYWQPVAAKGIWMAAGGWNSSEKWEIMDALPICTVALHKTYPLYCREWIDEHGPTKGFWSA
jgi:hypothetical protein